MRIILYSFLAFFVFLGCEGFGDLEYVPASAFTPSPCKVDDQFSCEGGDGYFDYRDGKSYPTVEIDGKCWFRKNLNYGFFATNQNTMRADTINKYCLWDTITTCSELGGYYTWEDAMRSYDCPSGESVGICPPGTHLPSAEEFSRLIDKYADNTTDLFPGGGSQLDMILSGFRLNDRGWDDQVIYFWSSTPHPNNPGSAYALYYQQNTNRLDTVQVPRSYGLCVRCLVD